MADRNTLGLGLASPTQQMACSSPEYSTGTSPLQGHSTAQHNTHTIAHAADKLACQGKLVASPQWPKGSCKQSAANHKHLVMPHTTPT
jgi:hypothetical protein